MRSPPQSCLRPRRPLLVSLSLRRIKIRTQFGPRVPTSAASTIRPSTAACQSPHGVNRLVNCQPVDREHLEPDWVIHTSVSRFSDIADNRSKSARVCAICDWRWTGRTPLAGLVTFDCASAAPWFSRRTAMRIGKAALDIRNIYSPLRRPSAGFWVHRI